MPSQKVAVWRKIQKDNFIDSNSLADFLELNDVQRKKIASSPNFNLNIPRRLAEKMTKGDIQDPLFKQFVPTIEEKKQSSRFILDPVNDAHFRKKKKLLQKYEGRVLILVSGACAMHCRFCFRQNFNYETQDKGFEEELAAIAKDPSIFEVILSGGDPLSLSNAALRNLIEKISTISHVKVLRFHTRFLVGIPERIDEEFLEILSGTSLQIVFVIHVNHPKELDEDVKDALKRIQKQGVSLLSQSVLLKGVNDDLEVLIKLCQVLVESGVMPYYLHQLDPVQGTDHFEIKADQGIKLIEQLREKLPGYAIPRFVQEIPGEKNKTLLIH